jgi:uncharacterized protein (TIGR03437 family)
MLRLYLLLAFASLLPAADALKDAAAKRGIRIGAANSAANPAKAGDVVLLYGTGGGALNPPATDGALVGAALPAPVDKVSVQIGGKDATIF